MVLIIGAPNCSLNGCKVLLTDRQHAILGPDAALALAYKALSGWDSESLL